MLKLIQHDTIGNMKKNYYVYIISNNGRTVFYTGITNNLIRRTYEHKNGVIEGFSKKYKLKYLLYFEQTDDVSSAISREKQLKNWHRQWKINLIKQTNPDMKDLDAEINSA